MVGFKPLELHKGDFRKNAAQVFLAGNAGMCFGVKRALAIARQTAEEAAVSGKNAYIVGQLVHNRQVSDYINRLGLVEITERELTNSNYMDSMFIIPSHGKGPLIYDIVRKNKGVLIDAVCPFVAKALKKAREAQADGYYILIYGDYGHEEVAGYLQWLKEDCLVVSEFEKDLAYSLLPEKLAVMTQTTADQKELNRLGDWLRAKGYKPLMIGSVCEATKERRIAAEKLAARVEAMLVVGGRNSANTKNLAAYCEKLTAKTFLVETGKDIDFRWFDGVQSIGITAGASTPAWIIKEVVEMMEEFRDQDQEREQTEEQYPALPDEAEGEVSQPEEEAAPEAVDVSEAVPEAALPDEESQEDFPPYAETTPEAAEDNAEEPYPAQPDETLPTASQPDEETAPESIEGPEQEAEVAEPEADQKTDAEREAEADFSEMEAGIGLFEFHPGDLIKGTVVKISSDEVLVDIGYKSEGIIPVFELAFTKVDPYTVVSVGDEIQVEVMKEDRDGNLVLSRKNALFEEKINLLEELFEKGEPIEATVIDVVKGGLLVDVGMRGFVPASHVERGFVKDLSEYLKQTLRFKILELNRSGRKVILSRKALLEEEYQKMKETFWNSIEEGQTRKGVVKRLTDFGAFVDIGGCDGLLHVSEMGWGKVGKPSDVVSINDEIEVFVLKVDRDKEKVSLSLKKLITNPWDLASEKYQVGSIYTGKVMRGASFGAFIQLEPSLEGLAHISQLARFRVNKVEDVLTEGMEVPVKILDIDLEKKRISLSVKEAIDLPKLVKDEPVEEKLARETRAADTTEEVTLETINEAADEAGSSSVAEAFGKAMAEAGAAFVVDEAPGGGTGEEAIAEPLEEEPEAEGLAAESDDGDAEDEEADDDESDGEEPIE